MSGREEILRISTEFYKSICMDRVPTPESTMNLSPDTAEIPSLQKNK